MAIDFKLPSLGENIDAGDIVSVLVQEGDVIQANQNVFEVETGKATVELPCPHAGKITKIHVKQGQSVPVGDVLLSLDAAAAESAPAKPAAKPAAPAEAKPAAAPPAKAAAPKPAPEPPAPAPAPVSSHGGGQASAGTAVMEAPAVTAPAGPATRRLARELGVDLARVNGTGAGGRITEEDVKKAVRESTAFAPAAKKSVTVPNATPGQDAWGPLQIQRLSRIRKTIAVNMARSSSTIPHVTNFDDADITELEAIRKGGMASSVGADVKLTMLPFVMKAVAHALQLHPVVNATLDMENDQVIYKDYVNLGVAVDTDRGLVVPVLRDVNRMTIPQIAQSLAEISVKARNNQFGLDDMRGGTFTISNLGAIGGTYSTPIINPPEVAILLVGRSRKLPVIGEDDEIKARLMMPLSLSYDHRLIDGAAAARFLNEVKNFLQVPGRLLLAN
ncbi:MAG TPA: 2-oxo acid dehydrogenase subunit E2 [Pirellulales bacterium]|nr:2-oxo acid dehydrogenase subunit E2 [Pirellulales bacterium]